MKKPRKIAVITLILSSFILFSVGSIFIITSLFGVKLDTSALPSATNTFVLYDKEDNLISENDYVTIDRISNHIKNAFIAIEDKRFYSHSGVDYKRIVGATIQNIKDKRFSQGGSTISNQLIKNTQLNGEKTVKRKLKEAKITHQLEKRYEKDQILEMYLNVIYFGKNIYGINNACKMIFGKLPMYATPIEAASLAATVANPSRYSILSNYKNNLERTRLVLHLMREQGFLSEDEFEVYNNADIIINKHNYNNNYDKNYYKIALDDAKKIISQNKINTLKGRYHIYTYFDSSLQKAAKDAIASFQNVESSNKEIIIADNETCGIAAYISSTTDSFVLKRQPGSLLKPFIYAKAIDCGKILPDSPLLDNKITLNGYSPKNFGDTYRGWITARDALSYSSNSVAVSLLNTIGTEIGAKTIINAGIPLDNKDKTLSLALGGTTYGSTLKDIAEGYLTLANCGKHSKTSFIRKITDQNGKILYQNQPNKEYVYSSEAAYLTTDMLKTCAENGTAKQLSYLLYDVAAKTGTVSSKTGNSDAWCAAYTTKNVLVCRYSSASAIAPLPNNVTGGNYPTKTLRNALNTIYSDSFPMDFAAPPFLKRVDIDKTIKEEFHKLVPYKNSGFGEKQSIYTTRNYTFDAVDLEKLLLDDLSVSADNGVIGISFNKFNGIDYVVYLNGGQCLSLNNGFYAPKQRFPIGKLEIYCKKDDRILWKTKRLVRLF